MADITAINYVLHCGEALLEFAKHIPHDEVLVKAAVAAIQRAQDTSNVVSTLLRELPDLPPHLREGVFKHCWQLMKTPDAMWHPLKFGMAARYGAEFWTAAEVDTTRREIAAGKPDFRGSVLVDILPVTTRPGAQDLVDAAYAHIAAQTDPNEALSLLVRVMVQLSPDGAERDMLRSSWFEAQQSDKARIDPLIEGFAYLASEDKAEAWARLKHSARAAHMSGVYLARVSALAPTSEERTVLLDEALLSCAASLPDERMMFAAEILTACHSADQKWRALELLVAAAGTSRDKAMTAIKTAAPVLADLGGMSLTRALMEDIRRCAAWWP